MEQNYPTQTPLLVPSVKRPVLEQKNLARINLGCGLRTPSGWVNVEGSYNARLAKHVEEQSRVLDGAEVCVEGAKPAPHE